MSSSLISISYQDAIDMRIYAEKYNDPDLYNIAANYFDVLGMELAAQRCRDRSSFYFSRYLEMKETIKISAYTNSILMERSAT
jgi:hypothetical protein